MNTEKCKIILVIDGIDRFEVDDNSISHTNKITAVNNTESVSGIGCDINNNVEEEPTDWFPESFPSNFRIILTCRPGSKAYHHFKSMKVPFRFLHMSVTS